MSILAERMDYVIGVDTHLHNHTAAVLTATGVVVASLRIDAEQSGYCRLVRLVGRTAPGKRVWAVEGTRSYGAGLTGHLLSLGETVGEVTGRSGRRVSAASRMRLTPCVPPGKLYPWANWPRREAQGAERRFVLPLAPGKR